MKVASGIVSAGSGALGRTVWSRNHYGSYIRERAVPVNPNTTFQQLIRSIFANLAVLWSATLTSVQRAGWETYALATPITDALGNNQILTGISMYGKCNAARLNAGKTRIDTAPAVGGLGILSPIGPSAVAATDTVTVSYINTDTWATAAGGHLFIYVSRPQKVTINSFKGPYRFLVAVNGAATPPTSPVAAVSPFPFSVGDRIFVRAQASNVDSKPSPNFRASVLAV
jgi:hypothetical protein